MRSWKNASPISRSSGGCLKDNDDRGLYIRPWLLSIRVPTLTAAVVPVLAATCLLVTLHLPMSPAISLFALIAALFIQIGTNLFNDALDFVKGADTACAWARRARRKRGGSRSARSSSRQSPVSDWRSSSVSLSWPEEDGLSRSSESSRSSIRLRLYGRSFSACVHGLGRALRHGFFRPRGGDGHGLRASGRSQLAVCRRRGCRLDVSPRY